jgi:predicted molibdopterin-dependent oxidoreductase YjgC
MLLDNMKIFTKNKRIKKARESVLEFLLVNHPLDVQFVIRAVSVIYKIF